MRRYILYIIVLGTFFACKKEEPPTDYQYNQPPNRQLLVTVKHRYASGIGGVKDSLVQKAKVSLYLNEDDRNLEQFDVAWIFTDSAGQAFFHALREDEHFIRVVHDSLGLQIGKIHTPEKTTSFKDIIYK